MLLDRSRFFVKEQVAILKLTDAYDIFDPDTEEQVGIAKEVPGTFVKLMRLLINKKLLPTAVEVRSSENDQLEFSIKRPVSFFRSQVDVFDAKGEKVGYFQSKVFSLAPSFTVFTADGQKFAEIKGKFFGRDFTFLGQGDKPVGVVKKKWQGLAKALFTSADNYLIEVDESMQDKKIAKLLLLAATLALDIVYYEK